MDSLGLGVRLNFDDNMSSQINPLIRDLERLRRAAEQTTQTINTPYDSHWAQRRRDAEDYRTSMQSMDRVLLNVSDRLIRATSSANGLANSLNRMQFTGNFGQMYGEMTRVQQMLGNMGYGMSQLQRDMSDMRAFNMLNYEFKDLKDRIKLTQQALKEMQASPDASKFTKEMDLAKRSLAAYQQQLQQVGSLRNKLVTTHGYGQTEYMGKDVLYNKPKTGMESAKNQLMGYTMMDVGKASMSAYKSLDKTGKMMTGLGYTTMEARQRLTQMLGTLQMTGMAMSQFVTVPAIAASVAMGAVGKSVEDSRGNFQARTLTQTSNLPQYETAMNNAYMETPSSKRSDVSTVSAKLFNSGVTDSKQLEEYTVAGMNFSDAYGGSVDAYDSVNTAMGISKKYGVDMATSFDLLSLALKNTNGDLAETDSWLGKNYSSLDMGSKKVTQAYETLQEGNNSGAINSLIGASKGVGGAFKEMWEQGIEPSLGKVGNVLGTITKGTAQFMQANPIVAKLGAGFLALGVGTAATLGPIALGTALMIRYRNVLQGVGLSMKAFTKGGLAVLPPQAKMAMDSVKAITTAFARFPQTVLKGAVPALYSFTRMLPRTILSMARMNPVMTALTVGAVAYAKNWFGIGDTVDNVVGKVKGKYTELSKAYEGVRKNGTGYSGMDDLSKTDKALLQVAATGRIAGKVIKSIFTGSELKFNKDDQNLIEGLGIENISEKLATAYAGVKSFVGGFSDGFTLVIDKVKATASALGETFEPLVVDAANGISKLFGGDGESKTFEDVLKAATGLSTTMASLGKIAGTALASFLAWKAVKPLLNGMFNGLVKNPFSGIVNSAKNATKAVRTMNRTIRSGVNSVRGTASTAGRAIGTAVGRYTGTRSTGYSNRGGTITPRGRDNPSVQRTSGNNTGGNSRIHANPTMSPLVRNGPAPMTAAQQRLRSQLVANENARSRGYNVGANTALRRREAQELRGRLGNNARIGSDGRYHQEGSAINGQQIHRRQQGRVSRALFGQAYDAYDEQGRRHNVNRQGGLLRRQSADQRITGRMGARDRAGQALGNAGRVTQQRVRLVYEGGKNATRNMFRPVTQQVRVKYQGAKNALMNTKAVKAIRIPVRYAVGRLNTAGIIRQGSQAGRRSGNLFTRGFRAASRAIRPNFSSASRGAQQAGRGAGGKFKRAFQSAAKGMKVSYSAVTRGASAAGRTAGKLIGGGIKGAVSLGLKAIPILGWAITAWEIIKTIFTNWSSIVSAAKTAWNWIKEDGVNALKAAWEAIKAGAQTAWDGIKTAAKAAWEWIKTDGIAMAQEIGSNLLETLSNAASEAASWVVSKLQEIPGLVVSVGTSIGTTIMNGIKSALSGLGSWVAGQIGSAASGAWGAVKGAFGGKKHANGGFVNSPHVGMVGEAGPEVIIPLSPSRRNRAQQLFNATASILGTGGAESGGVPTNNSLNADGQTGASLKLLSSAKPPKPLEKQQSDSAPFGSVSRKSVPQQVHLPTEEVRETSKPVVKTASAQPIVKEIVRTQPMRQNGSASHVSDGSDLPQVNNDFSVTVNNVNVQNTSGKEVTAQTGRSLAKEFAKELQKEIKQRRLRGGGKSLTLEEVILNM